MCFVVESDLSKSRFAGSVYYSESKYIQRGLPHAQLVSFDGIGHTW